jgi:ubiquinone/menaquinone biosynthesis C-methylase UbiE
MGLVPGVLWARLYDRINRKAEGAGLADERRRLIGGARGATIEIGAGTGLNLAHYPASVERLVLVEPDRHMTGRLRRRSEEYGRVAEIVTASAEELPFDGGTFDTAVVTFVLCTVDDPEAALAEIRRVLKPGGRLLFMEHVRSHDERLALRQDRVRPIYHALIDCNPNRDTLRAINSSGFAPESVRHGEVPGAPAIERPMIVGVACLAEQRKMVTP